MEGVEVWVAAGTKRALPFDIEAMASRVFDENTGQVVKDRHGGEVEYGTVVVLGPGRTDFAVRGPQETFVKSAVGRMWAAWVAP